jgi:membrane associated rhomboid family serine protease
VVIAPGAITTNLIRNMLADRKPIYAPLARIPARTRRQAMDWSLALLSQDIEATIDHSEDAGWGLLVLPEQHATAIETIRQYRRENLHWPWRQKVLRPGLLFDWGSLLFVALLAVFFWLSESHPGLRDAGLMDARQVSSGEWWRLFTSVLLHGDFGHFATNASVGLVMLGLVMGRYGTGVGLLAAYLAGVGGNLATWLIYFGGHRSLGASGMVMGCLGLLAIPFVETRHESKRKFVWAGIAGGVMLFVLFGLTPGTDVLAHFGGFVAGLLLGGILVLAPRIAERGAVNVCAGVFFAALVVWTWWLALQAIS